MDEGNTGGGYEYETLEEVSRKRFLHIRNAKVVKASTKAEKDEHAFQNIDTN